MAEREKVHFLGSLPIDTQLVELLDSASSYTSSSLTQGETSSTPQPTQCPTQASDLSPVTQLNTLSGANGHVASAATSQQSSLEPSFEVLERYKGTPTWIHFKPMTEYIIERLGSSELM
jgi:hypothetical protein